MRDPYTTEDGHSYEREAIEQWLLKNDTSPMTGAKLQRKDLIPAINLRNSIEEWQISQFNRIQMSELDLDPIEIGRGSFKTVYRAVWNCPGAPAPRPVAVLKMRSGSCDAEARTLIKLGRHPRVVRFHGMCNHEGHEYMVTEFAEFGSLIPGAFEIIEERGWDVSPGHALAIMQQVCSGMEALAAAGIVHRDLAGRNVLLFAFDPADAARTSAKVSDFGLAVSTYGASCHYAAAGAGARPVRHMAPESLERGRFSERSDVWSMGVLCWEVLTGGMLPFSSCGLVIHDDSEVGARDSVAVTLYSPGPPKPPPPRLAAPGP